MEYLVSGYASNKGDLRLNCFRARTSIRSDHSFRLDFAFPLVQPLLIGSFLNTKIFTLLTEHKLLIKAN